MIYAIAILAFVLSFFLSPWVVAVAHRLSVHDVQNERSSHEGIAVRGGGVCFIVVFYVCVLLYFLFSSTVPSVEEVVLLVAALVMALVGGIDDFFKLSARVRFVVQLAVVIVSVIFLPRLWPGVPVGVEKVVLVLAWAWFINLFNFMDGTDGYAAQESLMICLGLVVLGGFTYHLSLVLAGAVLGFLRVNWPKAKIFMGDTGSVFLGYLFAGFLMLSVTHQHLSLWQALALTSLFSFDATYTLVKRALQRKKIWLGHREHWFQRLNIAGFSHLEILICGICYNLVLILAMKLLQLASVPAIWSFVFALLEFACFAMLVRTFESKKAVLSSERGN